MTAVSKNVNTDKLDEIVDKYIKTCHRTTKMKSTDVKADTYIDDGVEYNNKDPRFKVGDCGNYKNISAKSYTSNWSEEVFVIKKVKNTVPWTCYC